jgi:serine protease Do
VKDLPAVSLGSSSSLRVGEYVVAVGNPFGLDHTVTMGIVSAKGRAIGAGPYDDFIQTDASINPGNSGGPLFDVRGRVVGINTAINPEGKGIGFAIPVDALKEVLPQLEDKGFVTRGKLGVAIQEVDGTLAKALGLDSPKGALVAGVEKGGPAEHAGLKAGDVIVAVDDAPIVHSQELPRTIARHAPGSKVTLDVVRDAKHQTIAATLDELKEKHFALDDQGSETRGRLGVGVADDEEGGARITQVAPKSAAAAAGLHAGDVIVEIDGKKVEDAADLKKSLQDLPKGKAVLAKVRRGDEVRWIGIDLG